MTIPNGIFSEKWLPYFTFEYQNLLLKIYNIRFTTKQSKTSITGISEPKLESSFFNSEVDIVGYHIIRMERSRRGGGVACYIKTSLSYNHKSSFYPNIESIFMDIFFYPNQSQLW